MSINMHHDIFSAMGSYNKNNNHTFAFIDGIVVGAVKSNTYTTDLELADLLLCSERTIKRSINKLCDLGFIKKHIAYDNTKTLELQEDTLNQFLNQYRQEGVSNG